MIARLRPLYYLAKDAPAVLAWVGDALLNLIPCQSCINRDWEDAVARAAAPVDVEEFDRIRAEALGEAECVEPPSFPAVSADDTPKSSTVGESRPGVEHSPAPPGRHPNLVDLIADVLAEHESNGCRCRCEESLWGADTWRAHVAPIIAERLKPLAEDADMWQAVENMYRRWTPYFVPPK